MRGVDLRMLCQLAVLAAALSCGSCSTPARPPSRPATRVYDRSMAQLGVIEFVVSDRARAERARELLEGVEVAFLEAETRRAEAARLAFGLARSSEPTDDEIRAAFRLMGDAAQAAFARYVAIQLELRRV